MEQYLCDGCTNIATLVTTLSNGMRLALCDRCRRTVTVSLAEELPGLLTKDELEALKAMSAGDKP